MKSQRTYIAIDLKSFYASVECVERGLDPLSARLVVADESRTSKTICLAVSPALKAYGIPGRPRLFEVEQTVARIKALRGEVVDYIIAPPRMALYMSYSRRVYETYLRYVAPEDIHVYSIDEVFMDVTDYLPLYGQTAHQLAMTMIRHVLQETGITATAGIGTNLYLSKVAMDIVAKHIPADEDGVRIAELDERSYRQQLWNHRPLTSFWRVGHGIANRLHAMGIDTMGQLARCSLQHEDVLYTVFGVNAELLIDHAWGWEPCTIQAIKSYRPATHSVSSGQVLSYPYTFAQALTVVKEMADALALDLFAKGLQTNQLTLTVGYDAESLRREDISCRYDGAVTRDHYGREVPRHAHGTANLEDYSHASSEITAAIIELYHRVVNPDLLVRRLNITACKVLNHEQLEHKRHEPVQLSFFDDNGQQTRDNGPRRDKENRMQSAILAIKQRFGKNAILRGTSFAGEATAKERNLQIGGHRG